MYFIDKEPVYNTHEYHTWKFIVKVVQRLSQRNANAFAIFWQNKVRFSCTFKIKELPKELFLLSQ